MVRNGIKARREAVGIRQAELAAQLRDVTAAAVLSGIESGYAMPTRTDMGILCEVLRCAPEDLYARPDRQERQQRQARQAAQQHGNHSAYQPAG